MLEAVAVLGRGSQPGSRRSVLGGAQQDSVRLGGPGLFLLRMVFREVAPHSGSVGGGAGAWPGSWAAGSGSAPAQARLVPQVGCTVARCWCGT